MRHHRLYNNGKRFETVVKASMSKNLDNSCVMMLRCECGGCNMNFNHHAHKYLYGRITGLFSHTYDNICNITLEVNWLCASGFDGLKMLPRVKNRRNGVPSLHPYVKLEQIYNENIILWPEHIHHTHHERRGPWFVLRRYGPDYDGDDDNNNDDNKNDSDDESDDDAHDNENDDDDDDDDVDFSQSDSESDEGDRASYTDDENDDVAN